MKETIYLIVLIVLLILNIFVSYKLFKDNFYDKKQKLFQFLIIWLIPIIGVLLVYFFLNRENKNKKNPYSGGSDVDWAGGNEHSSSGGSGD